MKNLRSSFALFSVLVFGTLLSPLAFGFSGGINGYSGNPATSGGASCTACHSGGAAPVVTLTGPNSVQPSSTSTYTLTISGGQSNAGGLDVSATGGALVATQANTLLRAGELTHQLPATATAGSVSWSFDWQAPAAAGNYTLYGAGLSSNGDGITTGDNSSTDALMVSVSTSAPQAPVAVIVAPKSAPTNSTISFDGSQSTDADGTINQYAWDFGDGSKATSAQAVHAYTVAGVYTVTLTVTDDANLTNTTFIDITIGGQMVPVADAGGPYSGSAGQAISFDASNSSHDSAITRYLWDFGDGSLMETTTTPTTTHTYQNAGNYTLTVAVQDANFVTGVVSTSVTVSNGAPPSPPPAATGEDLYISKCQVCHGVGGAGASAGNIVGRTATQITNAVANIPAMQSITLATGDAQKIADFLATGTPPPPPPPSATGEELYIAKCQACHGVGGAGASAGNIVGRSATQITNAVANIPDMQFITLAAGDAQKIADFLATGTPPPPPPPAATGEEIYIAKCQGCHGVGGAGASASNIVGASANQITNAVANIPAMQSITLSAADAQAVAEFLATGTPPPPTPPPTTGEGIYQQKCQACHGPNGTGGSARAVIGASANAITAAIANVPAMQSISLTPGEAQAVASFLATVARPTDGKGLYDMFCASCHGPEGKGGIEEAVVGEGYRSILEAINEEPDMQGLASALTNNEVRLIGNYLTSMENGGGDKDDGDKDSDMMRLQP